GAGAGVRQVVGVVRRQLLGAALLPVRLGASVVRPGRRPDGGAAAEAGPEPPHIGLSRAVVLGRGGGAGFRAGRFTILGPGRVPARVADLVRPRVQRPVAAVRRAAAADGRRRDRGGGVRSRRTVSHGAANGRLRPANCGGAAPRVGGRGRRARGGLEEGARRLAG